MNEPIKLALLAVGGDGGAVFTRWCVNLAAKNNYFVSATSIAGVAQRTGSTIYYLEFLPQSEIQKHKKEPVLSQMATPGDVDVVIATELVEIGRAATRGFITEQTTAIFSSHRSLAIQEKQSGGDEIIDPNKIIESVKQSARKTIYANFKTITEKNRSVISASLFGALSASGVLPFKKEDFEQVIIDDKVGVENSLAAFNQSYQIALTENKGDAIDTGYEKPTFESMPSSSSIKQVNEIIERVKTFPKSVQDVAYAGAIRVAKWQDEKWANQYLDDLHDWLKIDDDHPANQDYELSKQIARYLAIAMTYDDLVYVAGIKTTKKRHDEARKQVDAKDGQIVNIMDYLHPRYEEICGIMPKNLGLKLSKNKKMEAFFEKRLNKDRRMYTTRLFNFLMLYVLGGMRKYRFKTLRHHEEMENIHYWEESIKAVLKENYDLAVLVAKCYRLKKGYSDTYLRSHSKFAMLVEYAKEIKKQKDAAKQFEPLYDFALKKPSPDDLKQYLSGLKQGNTSSNK